MCILIFGLKIYCNLGVSTMSEKSKKKPVAKKEASEKEKGKKAKSKES